MSVINKISRDIFKAIHEGKWIAVEYRNKQQNVTKYWIGIKNINPYGSVIYNVNKRDIINKNINMIWRLL